MTLQEAKLTIEADVDGDGSAETGIFRLVGDLEVVPSIRTGFLVGGRGSTVNAITSELLGNAEQRRGFFVDLGGGRLTVEVNFRGWEGATDDNGNNLQWGNDSAQTVTQASATGADPITQIDVLMRYLTVAEIDSRNPATLAYGEYSSSGLYSPLDVAIEGPNFTRAADEGQQFTGSMTFVSVANVSQAVDTLPQLPF